MAIGFACGLSLEPRAAWRVAARQNRTPAIPAMSGQGRNRADRSALPPIPFGAVNRAGRVGYVAGLQRHHLLPRVLIGQPCFARLIEALRVNAAFEDFRRNGMLLPATEGAAVRMGLPLHRGPHRAYSDMVRERLGGIEEGWAISRNGNPDEAGIIALRALAALQADLRRNLLDPSRTVRLNRHDPLGSGTDFTRIDAMAETLWGATQRPNGAVLVASAAIAA